MANREDLYDVVWSYGWDEETDSSLGGRCVAGRLTLPQAVRRAALELALARGGEPGAPVITDAEGRRDRAAREALGCLVALLAESN